MKFAVVGLGGVGGTLGALLAKGGKDVAFIARGEHLAAIRKEGLHLDSGFGSFVAAPRIATDDAREVGVVDCVLVCTKSYGLEGALKSMAPMIGKDTLVISTLNGVGNAQRLKELGCGGIVVDGCIYIIAQREGPGRILHKGQRCRVVFGGAFDEAIEKRLLQVESEMRSCNIDAQYARDIEAQVWSKFAMINATGMTQAYYKLPAGGIRQDPKKYADLKAAIAETAKVARALGINVPDDLEEKTLEIYDSLRPEDTASVQRDLEAGCDSEVQSFGPYLVQRAKEAGVDVPVLARMSAPFS